MIAGYRTFFIISAFFILISGLLQKTQLADFYGIKVNLVLVLILILAILIDNPWHYLVLVFWGSLLLKIGSGLSWQNLILVLVAAAAFFGKKYLAGKPMVNVLVLIIGGTAIFYALLDFRFLISYPAAILTEIIYNTAAALIFYNVFNAIRS